MTDHFNVRKYYDCAWEAHRLFMAGMTAREVGRALGIPAETVYKCVACVARNPRPYEEAWRRELCRMTSEEAVAL